MIPPVVILCFLPVVGKGRRGQEVYVAEHK